MILKLKSKKHEVGNIHSFFFEPLESVNWLAGQYFNLTMPDVAPVFANRLFTIASAPHEKHIQVTTFIGKSPFKQKLNKLPLETEVEADQIGGDFYWLDSIPGVISGSIGDPVQRLYLAGGLGITPFRSIILDCVYKKKPNNSVLLWSGSDEKCPFIDELSECSNQDASLQIKRFSTERITIDKIYQQVPDVTKRLIYIAGSQEFVESLGDGLMARGIPRSQIKYDWFDGYTGSLV